MKTLQLKALGELEFAELPQPKPEAGQVLVKTKALGIFRSEFVPLLRGADPRTRAGDYLFRGFPFRFSADCVGEVAELGKGVEGFSAGDRVTYVGRLAPYSVVPVSSLVPIADHLTDEEGTFPIHFGVVLNGIHKLRIGIGDSALVVGQGPLGVAAAQWCKLGGARQVIVADRLDGRLALAKRCGVDHTVNTVKEDLQKRVFDLTDGEGADIVVEATAAAPAFELALSCARMRGQVLMLGFHAFPVTIEKPIYNFLRPELTIYGTFASGPSHEKHYSPYVRDTSWRNWKIAADMIASGRMIVAPLVSHRLPFDQVKEAFRLLEVEADTTMRVHVSFD